MLFWFGTGQIDFIQNRDDRQIMVDGHIQIRKGLRLDALCCVDKQDRTFACSKCARYLVGEIHVSRGVDHAECVFRAINGPGNAHSLGFDGDASLLLDIHAVEETIMHFSLRNDPRHLQNAICNG